MTYKVQLIIAEIKRRINKLNKPFYTPDTPCGIALQTYKEMLSFIDSLQEEPVSENLRDESETIVYQGEVYTRVYRDEFDKFANKYPKSVPHPPKKYAKYSDVDLTIAVKAGASAVLDIISRIITTDESSDMIVERLLLTIADMRK